MLADLTITEINIPFKVSFKHASAERKTTAGILVKAIAQTGETGYGEGCPRPYVTSESISTAVAFFNENKASIIEIIETVEDVKNWAHNNRTNIDKNPAAWCAIELALIDLIAKRQRQSIEAALGLPELQGSFYYSAVLGDSEKDVFIGQAQKYMALGFRDFKIKLSGKIDTDKEKIEVLMNLNIPGFRLRADANNLWKELPEAVHYFNNLNYAFFAIEEPLIPGAFELLSELSKKCNTKVILDESFLKVEDLDKLEDPSLWVINLRISKMGGLMRSKEIAEKAQEKGIPIIIGAQVGETSILTRAALTIGNAYRDNLIAQEGAFGTILLEKDLCTQPVMFGKGGVLSFTPQEEFGMQLKINGEDQSN